MNLDELIKSKETSFNPEENFGWLEPNGDYHPVSWGEHSSWAVKYTLKEYPPKDNKDLYQRNGQRIVGGDMLVYSLGWVLLNNPDNPKGMPRISKSPEKELTKAQKEFLYEHFYNRGMKEEANNLYKDDNFVR